jgi:hypothetical protein
MNKNAEEDDHIEIEDILVLQCSALTQAGGVWSQQSQEACQPSARRPRWESRGSIILTRAVVW